MINLIMLENELNIRVFEEQVIVREAKDQQMVSKSFEFLRFCEYLYEI